MFKSIYFALLIAVFAWSCQTQKTGTTATGYKYIHFERNSGKKAQPNQYAYCNVYIYQNDTLISSNIMSGVETAMIPVSSPDSASLDDQPIMAALVMMASGDSLVIFHNIDSLKKYAPPGYPIPNIAYHIKLKSIENKEQYEKDMQVLMDKRNQERELSMARAKTVEDSLTSFVNAYKAGKLDPRMKTTTTGLKYIILNEGKGDIPKMGTSITTNYHGMLMDGTVFDSSFSRGQPFGFPLGVGQVISGWDEGFSLLKKGSTALLLIPAEQGYGKDGAPPTIPANADLAFYVELL